MRYNSSMIEIRERPSTDQPMASANSRFQSIRKGSISSASGMTTRNPPTYCSEAMARRSPSCR